uniref:High-affinity choline transporter 1-like n=1 Tax=Ascaris lumbricoides TaxID=6252 RepID=A0A0M3IPZ3_ASCLU
MCGNQVYFQRVLSSKSSSGAQKLSFIAGVGCIIMAIPPALIGAIARNTDWRLTDYDPWGNGTKSESIPDAQTNMVVPLVFQYLTPKWVAFIGLGAVSAAVMSSADSSVLSAASMFAHNIWKLAIRPHACEREVIIVMRIAIVAVGFLATLMALTINSIYGLWYLCADLVYVILFPQLVCVVYMQRSNTYGSISGYIVGLLLRLSGGEPLLSFPALIHYPMYEEYTLPDGTVSGTQYFPFRTMAMLGSFITCVGVSLLSEYLFKSGKLSVEMDFLTCVVNIPPERITLPSDTSFNVSCDTLAMQKLKEGSGTYVTTNGFLGPCSPANELSALHTTNNKDYLTLHQS